MKAPAKPRTSGSPVTPTGSSRRSSSPPGAKAAMRAKAPMNEGSTSGRGSSSRMTRRPGRSVRITSQAASVPTAAAAAATVVASSRLRPRGPRSASSVSVDQTPPSSALRTIR